ncbi:MAG: sulfatase-like hydrolase/transferase [Bacteroidetes bacterium]|nr:sulfatase-like hydrolase/transferase [Bacteroidota bacterium]
MLRKIIDKIPQHVKIIAKLYILSMLFFSFFRIVFYFTNQSKDIAAVPFFQKLYAFRMGFEFDSACLLWILSIPILLLSISYIINRQNKSIHKFTLLFFALLLNIYLFVCTVNIPYHKQFGSFLNKNALLWNDEPSFIIGMIFGSFSYWGFLLLFILSSAFFTFYFKKLIKQHLSVLKQTSDTKIGFKLLITLVLFTITFFGIRGRGSFKSTLHEGFAIVGENPFINQIALNPNYTFWKSLFYKNNNSKYVVPTNIDELFDYTKNYLGVKINSEQYNIARDVKADTLKPNNNYNVIIVIMESMCVYKMGYYNGKDLTPQLHKLNKESVFCKNFFSSGIHTYNGLFSTISGYPSILAEKSMREYLKKPFRGIGTLLKEENYDTYFYTTHDPHFDNMKGFYTMNGFDNFISQNDFNSGEAVSTLGVPDHVLLNKLIETHKNASKPFLSVVMTASDHGPWVVPENIPFKPSSTDERDRCTQYADWAIGNFMDNAKKQSWYKNTIFIFLGDHGLSMGHTYEMPISYNHIPCIIHQAKILKADTISAPCYQPDITATVMDLLNKSFTNETFGTSVFKTKRPFVFFSADDKYGCVDSSGNYFYQLLQTNTSYLRKYKSLDPINYLKERKSISDSLAIGSKSILESARYLIRKNQYSN